MAVQNIAVKLCGILQSLTDDGKFFCLNFIELVSDSTPRDLASVTMFVIRKFFVWFPEITAREWRLLGQEQDGTQLLSWIATKDDKEVLNIGLYTNKTKTLTTLYNFKEKFNIIQASVNATHTLLIYVVKQLPYEDGETLDALYCPYLLCLLSDKPSAPVAIEESSTKQIMVQYVYGKSNKYSPGIRNDRFILFKHLECK